MANRGGKRKDREGAEEKVNFETRKFVVGEKLQLSSSPAKQKKSCYFGAERKKEEDQS